MSKTLTTDQRLDKIDAHLERVARAIAQGFANSDEKIDASRDAVRTQVDIYARAVDAYAKQSETYMQEMLALGAKVDRLERQIEQIAKHLSLKLEY